MVPWLTEVRKTALVAFVTLCMSLLLLLWSMTSALFSVGRASGGLAVLALWVAVLSILASGILPWFCYALYGSDLLPNLPRPLRTVVIVTAIFLGIETAVRIYSVSSAMGADLTAVVAMRDWAVGASSLRAAVIDTNIAGVLALIISIVADCAYVLLLLALIRLPSDADVRLEPSLKRASGFSVVLVVLMASGSLIQTAYLAFNFSEYQRQAALVNRSLPPFSQVVLGNVWRMLQGRIPYVAPCVIYIWQRGIATNSVETPESTTIEPAGLQ